MPLPIAVLVSGGGSNLQSIIDRIEEGVLDVEIKLVFSNRARAFGLERAKAHGIPRAVLSHKDFRTREDFDREMVKLIHDHGVTAPEGAVVMAGFMRVVTNELLGAFPNRVLNIHPALLPSFPGVDGQGAAADYGVKISGCTVHFVDEEMDRGPVVIQAAVPCQAGEDGGELAPRILKLEHRVLPQAIQWLAQDRLSIENRHVHVKVSGIPLAEPPKADIEPRTCALVWPPLEEGF